VRRGEVYTGDEGCRATVGVSTLLDPPGFGGRIRAAELAGDRGYYPFAPDLGAEDLHVVAMGDVVVPVMQGLERRNAIAYPRVLERREVMRWWWASMIRYGSAGVLPAAIVEDYPPKRRPLGSPSAAAP
jgi:hypothetical protein